jgi:hypothetical protein
LAEYGSDEALLRRIAEFTGGRFNPSPAAVFDPAGRAIASALRLWPGLLALALALNLAELLWRKWSAVGRLLKPGTPGVGAFSPAAGPVPSV